MHQLGKGGVHFCMQLNALMKTHKADLEREHVFMCHLNRNLVSVICNAANVIHSYIQRPAITHSHAIFSVSGL